MDKNKIIAGLISGKIPEQDIIKLEKKYPGITEIYKRKSNLLDSFSKQYEYEPANSYFSMLVQRSLHRKKSKRTVYKARLAFVTVILIVASLLLTYLPQSKNSEINFTNEEILELAEYNGGGFLQTGGSAKEDLLYDSIPDSVLDDMKYQNINYTALVEYYFTETEYDNNFAFIHEQGQIYDY